MTVLRYQLVWLLILSPTGVFCQAPDDVVTFPDAALEAAVRSVAGKPDGSLLRSNISGITRLWWKGEEGREKIVDLTGISQLDSLTSLDLDQHGIRDLAPLSSAAGLNMLSLNDNEIIDITPLSELTELEALELADNLIFDVSPLSPLIWLSYLELRNNSITDVTPLANLAWLRDLELDGNPVTDFTPLRDLFGLGPGRFRSASIQDVDYLQDGVVDFSDFLNFAGAWGSDHRIYDLDGSGRVGFDDFLIFASFFMQTYDPSGSDVIPDLNMEITWPETLRVGETGSARIALSPRPGADLSYCDVVSFGTSWLPEAGHPVLRVTRGRARYTVIWSWEVEAVTAGDFQFAFTARAYCHARTDTLQITVEP